MKPPPPNLGDPRDNFHASLRPNFAENSICANGQGGTCHIICPDCIVNETKTVDYGKYKGQRCIFKNQETFSQLLTVQEVLVFDNGKVLVQLAGYETLFPFADFSWLVETF